MDVPALNEIQEQLTRQWQLDVSAGGDDDVVREMMIAALTERVLYLLQEDNAKLMRALYILDISEKRYNAAMKKKPIEAAARALAIAIYDRESEKIEMRKKYTRGKDTPVIEDKRDA